MSCFSEPDYHSASKLLRLGNREDVLSAKTDNQPSLFAPKDIKAYYIMQSLVQYATACSLHSQHVAYFVCLMIGIF